MSTKLQTLADAKGTQTGISGSTWFGEFGQRAKMYPTRTNGCDVLCLLANRPFETGVFRYISLAGRGAGSHEIIEVHGGAEGLHRNCIWANIMLAANRADYGPKHARRVTSGEGSSNSRANHKEIVIEPAIRRPDVDVQNRLTETFPKSGA